MILILVALGVVKVVFVGLKDLSVVNFQFQFRTFMADHFTQKLMPLGKTRTNISILLVLQ